MSGSIIPENNESIFSQCGACGAQDIPLTYRLGLDLFVCRPCNAQPNLGAKLVEEFFARYKNRDVSL